MQKNIILKNAKPISEQTKAQKAFYKELKNIEKEKKHIEMLKAREQQFKEQRSLQLIPSEVAYVSVKAEWIKLLFRWRNTGLSTALSRVITRAIVEESYPLIETFEQTELIPLYNECSTSTFEEDKAEEKAAKEAQIRDMFAQEGVEIEGDMTEENIIENMTRLKEAAEKAAAERAAKQAQKKKSARRMALEALKEAQISVETKSLRQIYTQLAKAFHPDTEPDETERERKTRIMQRITAAYEANDLPELLRLQIEFEQISMDNIETLAEDKLKVYTNILKAQARTVRQEYDMLTGHLQMEYPMIPGYIWHREGYSIMDFVNQEVRRLEAQKANIETDIACLLGAPAEAKKLLKRLKKEQDAADQNPFADMQGFLKEILRGM